MKTTAVALLTAAVFVAGVPGTLSAASEDEAAIRKTIASFVEAWNHHDTKAMAAVFAEDGDLINPSGRAGRGRAQIEALFADEHAHGLRASTFTLQTSDVRLLAPTVALSEWTCEITGIHDPEGHAAPPLKCHVVVLYQKRNGAWVPVVVRPYAFLPPPGGQPVPGK